MIHKVKGSSVVNETEADVFLEFPCFLYDPASVGNYVLVPLFFFWTQLEHLEVLSSHKAEAWLEEFWA